MPWRKRTQKRFQVQRPSDDAFCDDAPPAKADRTLVLSSLQNFLIGALCGQLIFYYWSLLIWVIFCSYILNPKFLHRVIKEINIFWKRVINIFWRLCTRVRVELFYNCKAWFFIEALWKIRTFKFLNILIFIIPSFKYRVLTYVMSSTELAELHQQTKQSY